MRTLFIVAAAAAAGALAYQKAKADQQDARLWAEATDQVR
ncbi:MAG: DLW-39 family protein [Actinomycetales bacterium]